MKRTTTTSSLPRYTFEGRYELIREVFDDVIEPRLLEKRETVLDTPHSRPSIEWLFCRRSDGCFLLEVVVRYGAFAEIEKRTTRKWTALDWITWTEVENALLRALTFDGSPYCRNGARWTKRMEIAG